MLARPQQFVHSTSNSAGVARYCQWFRFSRRGLQFRRNGPINSQSCEHQCLSQLPSYLVDSRSTHIWDWQQFFFFLTTLNKLPPTSVWHFQSIYNSLLILCFRKLFETWNFALYFFFAVSPHFSALPLWDRSTAMQEAGCYLCLLWISQRVIVKRCKYFLFD